ncbi:ABC transporter substrate-binding protein [Comamonadaceae bacterium OH2545_COT-014]|nr:ABC transporter substrate-binding protein [Comamonadaceae bacterium OH2545_COT-014]
MRTPQPPAARPDARAGLTRRRALAGAAALTLAPAGPALAQTGAASAANTANAAAPARLPRLVLAGPYAAVSYPLLRIVESGALADVADKVEFIPWKNPDQLRALAVGQSAGFMAMPSNVAANLYNRGVPLRLLNISAWGLLWMISRDAGLKTLADFRGKEVVMPFRGDMPDIVFRLLATRQGIDPDKDLTLRYVASPLDAMQLLLTRRADHALLAEPAASVGLRKSGSFPVSVVAPELHRSVNLQAEWGRVLQRPPRIPQAGITVLGPHAGNAALVARFQQAYADALRWCQADPAACGQMTARHIDMLTPEGVADSVRVDNAAFVTASAARPELEFFFQQLLARQPGLVGGKLPDDGFYLGGA